MRTIDTKTTENILKYASLEFMEKNFLGGNIRDIAKKCNVSSHTIYTRFGNKEGLFTALVKEKADEFLNLYNNLHNNADVHADYQLYQEEITDNEVKNKDYYYKANEATDKVLDFLLKNRDSFKLLFCKSEGTEYATYLDKITEIEEKNYMKLFDFSSKKISKSKQFFLHKLAQESSRDLYEIISNDMKKEEAKEFIELEKRFRMSGWKNLLKELKNV
ncbi:regulatory protein, tetR family [Acetitomaculum ruminis DSM 5522]|uniref:Regulatory protein, tetR family n=1 Tax=Acetitomaculum ruminis DSM 5522 TaxID=1120918 RepID=A0A1I1A9N1_9FIRM|nr:TetR/AcrR family transcriptional regulator [Acetitomaculum ruminis]SFB34684.1 regulatory protein, tetR family [Acetitomaculum ruminis DSM 5522]